MWWNPAFILLIIFSTAVNYSVGIKMSGEDNAKSRKLLLIAALSANLGLLFFFKYFGLFSDSLLGLMRILCSNPSWVTLNITLPVGISFYTFQTMSYTIDVYRKKISPTNAPIDFALFVAFFPQLVAGPIVRAATFLPQLNKPIKIFCDQQAIFLILRGFAKKVLIADNIAILVDGVFLVPGDWPSIIIWIATIGFAIQIYCDFSGYSDIAIGIAKILGFKFPQNFNHPYIARNPSDYWKRWHISLSSWLRDYLYISLGGNRGGDFQTYRNLMLTMLLGGLWHGASWNFLLWGFLHGAILIIHRWFSNRKGYSVGPGLLAQVLSILMMQYCVLVTWIAFRITHFPDMLIAMRKFILFDFDFQITNIGVGSISFFTSILIMIFFVLLQIFSIRVSNIDEYLGRVSRGPALAVCSLLGFIAFFFWPLSQAPFIYFQF
ncbi:MAG: MBOAT family O-acyltransferase [Pseudomonadota bacterium]|nr:MBOAT family O-acyltransferase [Pseudomonadota bacterium]